jgi:hypothetical protein
VMASMEMLGWSSLCWNWISDSIRPSKKDYSFMRSAIVLWETESYWLLGLFMESTFRTVMSCSLTWTFVKLLTVVTSEGTYYSPIMPQFIFIRISNVIDSIYDIEEIYIL